jgi:hypothetical protein
MFNPGDTVYFLGCSPEQIAWGSNDDPNKVLTQGYVYGVERVEVHTQHTKIKIVGHPGMYNSACFERYPI